MQAELKIADKTFVVYSSGHGYKQGQWRVGTSKQHPYETDIHVPLLFAGPNIPKGLVQAVFADWQSDGKGKAIV